MSGSATEEALRGDLYKVVSKVRGTLGKYPIDVTFAGDEAVELALDLLDDLHHEVAAVESINMELERLADLSSEGMLLCGATKVAVRLLVDALAVLSAEVDSGEAAA